MRRLITIIVLTAIALGVFAEATQSRQQVDKQQKQYWQMQGCDHGHRSVVAYKRVSQLLKNQTPLTVKTGKKVQHYRACVTTKKKSKAVTKLIKKLKKWRKVHVCGAGGTPGLNYEAAKCMARRDHGWIGSVWNCISGLVSGESGWNHLVSNYAGSGAYGIPQALPGDKMSSHGSDWRWNPITQIRWMFDYIISRYGTPCGAYAFKLANNWY